MITINEINHVTEEIFQAFQDLIPQLTQNSPSPSQDSLQRMVDLAGTFIFLAWQDEDKKRIIGSATLCTYQSPTGLHAWIEDVVVDVTARRQGIGKALTEACIEKARSLGLHEVNLTSRPSREAANRLYQAMGFVRRETNVYRYHLD